MPNLTFGELWRPRYPPASLAMDIKHLKNSKFVHLYSPIVHIFKVYSKLYYVAIQNLLYKGQRWFVDSGGGRDQSALEGGEGEGVAEQWGGGCNLV